jgi:hypothetical protein
MEYLGLLMQYVCVPYYYLTRRTLNPELRGHSWGSVIRSILYQDNETVLLEKYQYKIIRFLVRASPSKSLILLK